MLSTMTLRCLRLFCFLLLHGVVESSFVVMFPRTVVKGRDFPVTINVVKTVEPITVRVKVLDSGNVVSSAYGIMTSGSQYLMGLKIPRNYTSTWNQARLRVETEGGIEYSREYTLSVYWGRPEILLVQTDKAIYKRGQTVRFRVLALDIDLYPLQGPFDVIIKDPHGNRIAQWLNVKDHDNDIFESQLIMSDDPVLGDWKINAKFGDLEKTQVFTVAEYGTLPVFEVQLKLPSIIRVGENITGSIMASYTFGRDVRGTVVMYVRQRYPPYQTRNDPVIYEKTANISGRLDFEIEYTLLLKLFAVYGRGLPYQQFNVTITVTDTSSKQSMSASQYTMYKTTTRRLSFSSPNYYKPGFIYSGQIKVTDEAGSMTQGDIILDITEYLSGGSQSRKTQTIKYGSDGMASFGIQTTNASTSLRLYASSKDCYGAYKYVYNFQSESGNYLTLKMLTTSPKVRRKVWVRVQTTEKVMTLFYQFYAKRNLVSHGILNMKKRLSKRFTFYMSPKMSPRCRLMVYYFRPDNKEMIMDVIDFDTAGMFPNRLLLKIRKNTKPGALLNLLVKTEPGSTVSLLGVDKSTSLLKTGNDINANMVKNAVDNFARMYSPYGRDVYQVLQSAGIEIMTDVLPMTTTPPPTTVPTRPTFGIMSSGTMMAMTTVMTTTMMASTAATEPRPVNQETTTRETGQTQTPTQATSVKIRQLFPETWLWDTFKVSSANGSLIQKVKVPDTITTWTISGFSLSRKHGFGVTTSPALVTVFLPFFIKLNLPFSAIRGEIIIIDVSIFNYVRTNASIEVTLKGSITYDSVVITKNGHQNHVQEDVTKTITVKENEPVSVYFPIIPKDIGEIELTIIADGKKRVLRDAVTRPLLIEPEGVEHEYSMPFPVSLSSSNSSFNETIELTYPASEVPQSRKITFYATGDLMGLAINGLENLLKMPYGCGEQNMVGFAPDVFVMKYLTKVGKLKPEIRTKGLDFMIKGYQRQLKFRRYEGSFSAFGNMDNSGSVWLTAFVIKSFVQASSLIDIDDKIIIDGVRWILRQQSTDGSFRQYGQFSFSWLKGHSQSSNVAFTSFVLIALLEADKYNDEVHSAVEGSLSRAINYLSSMAYEDMDVYSLAILSYAFALSENEKLPEVMIELEKRSTTSGVTKHWERITVPSSYSSWTPPSYQTQAINIEITAYVLLTYTVIGDKNNGYLVKTWLARQQRSEGGFKSTQDTVIALQALAEYNTKSYVEQSYSGFHVGVATPSGFKRLIQITKENELLLQSFSIPPEETTLSVIAQGTGSANIVVATSFHVYEDVYLPSFSIMSNVVNETMSGFKIRVCARKLKTADMIMGILEIGIPTGFSAETTDVSVSSGQAFKKVEEGYRKLIVYYDIIPAHEFCVTSVMTRDTMVAKQKPVPIRFYDYYEPKSWKVKPEFSGKYIKSKYGFYVAFLHYKPEIGVISGDEKTVFYVPKLLSDLSLCDVCGEECNCSV